MNREELSTYIYDTYGINPDVPWSDDTAYPVFRHPENRKWFALIMNVPCGKLGLETSGSIDIVNLKCDPEMIPSVTREPGIFPAYHMSKTNWVSVALDGSASDDKLKVLLDMSFGLTEKKVLKSRKPNM